MATNGVHKTTILITGAAGWLGGILKQQLSDEILKNPTQTPNPQFILADIVEPKKPKGSDHAVTLKADLTDPKEIDSLFNTELGVPDVIYCLHGIMSRGSEDNFDLGLKVNIDSIREVLQATRRYKTQSGDLIKFVFTSSLAVYGGPAVMSPNVVDINTIATPEGAYGMGKLSSELLVNEFTRRGLVDGRILRLPTIVVRPGVPSAATSAFISGIIREPLHGVEGICPVGNGFDAPELSLEAWVASPETTIQNFVRAMHVPAESFLKHTRVVYLPGFTVTVKEELEALEAVAGKEALQLVKFKDDPTNRRIVGSWPARFDIEYPLSLGFTVDKGGMIPIVQRFKEAVDAGLA